MRTRKRNLAVGSMMIVMATSLILVPGTALADADSRADRSVEYPTDGWAHRSEVTAESGQQLAEVPSTQGWERTAGSLAAVIGPQLAEVPSAQGWERTAGLPVESGPQLAEVPSAQGWERTAGLPVEIEPRIVTEPDSTLVDDALLATVMLILGLGLGIGGGIAFTRTRAPRAAH